MSNEEQNGNPTAKEDSNYLKCPFCESKEVVKCGFRDTSSRGKIQIYSCKKCNKTFSQNTGFYKMKNNEQKITACLDMYYKGMSLRQIQAHLKTFYPHNVSHMTILRWIRKYTKQISSYTDTIKINNSDSIMFDEVEYKTKGKESFFIGVMDLNSRYIVSSDFVYERNLDAFNKVFSNAKARSKNRVYKFYSDGLGTYRKALKQSYHFRNHWKKFQHNVKVSTSSKQDFNWEIERFNNTLRARTKTMRGFKSIDSAKLILKGFEIYYNFIRVHTGLNKVPYENVIDDLQLGQNKWLDLIRMSA